jgi:hypothetical protein
MKPTARSADALQEAIVRVQASHPQDGPGGIGPALEFLQIAQQIALGHHEKWDGSGYPQGLAGEAIPVAARLMALADVFDALICKRHYKEPYPIERAAALITEGRGATSTPRWSMPSWPCKTASWRWPWNTPTIRRATRWAEHLRPATLIPIRMTKRASFLLLFLVPMVLAASTAIALNLFALRQLMERQDQRQAEGRDPRHGPGQHAGQPDAGPAPAARPVAGTGPRRAAEGRPDGPGARAAQPGAGRAGPPARCAGAQPGRTGRPLQPISAETLEAYAEYRTDMLQAGARLGDTSTGARPAPPRPCATTCTMSGMPPSCRPS